MWHIHFLNFDLLLINSNRYLVFRVYFSPCQRNIVREWIKTSRETNHEMKANIFTCFWHWCWKNWVMNNFYKQILRSNCLQMFFKISALKNFAILRIKMRLQHRCFRVRSSHMMLTYWWIFSQNTFHRIFSYFRAVNIVKF